MSEIINLKLLLLLFSFTDSFVFLYLVLISIKNTVLLTRCNIYLCLSIKDTSGGINLPTRETEP